jgi:hypothetical protein
MTAEPTETPTPTPITAVVAYLYGLNMRAQPDVESELLAFLPAGTIVVVLDGRENVNGQTWQQVQFEALSGWVLANFLQ